MAKVKKTRTTKCTEDVREGSLHALLVKAYDYSGKLAVTS